MTRWLLCLVLAALALNGCGSAVTSAPTPTSAPTAAAGADSSQQADLSGIKTYLLDRTQVLTTATAALKSTAERYYTLAKGANFDYAALLSGQRADVAELLAEAKRTWQEANPAYEQMEGLVAGVPSLSKYDVILDAGTSADEDAQSAVPFDLSLPDGRVLKQPGNFFYLTETALWGTRADFTATGVEPDLDGDGNVEFGEALPDAAFLLAAASEFDRYTNELATAAQAWQPNESDVFTALVVMTPTMSEYFESWKHSRFVAGEEATEAGFVGASRLSDIVDILKGLQVAYAGVRPRVAATDPAQGSQIGQSLDELHTFVADIYAQEQGGKRFSADEADLLGTEAQNRATAITGQITQAAAKLSIQIDA